ncbi:MAG: PKD domain containing protein, partial [Cytophagaceae bacterium]
MRFVLTSILLFLTYLSCFAAPGESTPGESTPGESTPGIVFVENKGQWASDILFRADLPGGFLFLKQGGLHYVFYDTRETARRHAAPIAVGPISPTIRAHGVGVSLANQTGSGRVDGINPVGTLFSYFIGNDPSRWAGGVRGFPEVIYHDVYPGINLRIYAYYQTLKYEFVVQPGADPAKIQLTYTGADQLSLTDNRLIIKTSVNEFRENAPYSFVTRADKATEVPTRWVLDGQVARFDFPKGYDNTQALTIDPELVFTTFSGSRADNFGHTATYDSEGNTYAAGSVWGPGFPATTGAFQVDYAGQTDVGIMKFSPDGSRLLYAVNLGGSGADLPHSAVVNSKGELIIMGSTASPTFPTTVGAFQRGITSVRGGGTSVYGGYLDYTLASDLFIARLTTDGKSLIGSTLLGGSDNDGLNLYVPPLVQLPAYVRNYSDEFRGEVIVGPNDDVYVASTSLSADFPVTDGSKLSGFSDGVVCRLSADLTQLRWSTRISGNSVDEAHGLRLSPDGTLYVCGSSYSTNLGTTGSLQPQLAGLNDGYLARLTEGKITALTYLGTSFSDVADLVDIGPDNSPHVLGLTRGLYPVSANVYTNARSGQFIHALSPDLSKTVFSTVIGTGRALQANGSITGPDIAPTAFLVNACGNIYLAGWGGSVNQRNGYNAFSTTAGLPVTPDAYQTVTSASNFWIGVLERGAKSLLYGTFMGDTRTAADAVSDGDHVDGGTCRFDKDGTIYHAACSCRTNLFP